MILLLVILYSPEFIMTMFNDRSSVRWARDKNEIKGKKFESLRTANRFRKLIPQPTHLLPPTSSSIDLIFPVV